MKRDCALILSFFIVTLIKAQTYAPAWESIDSRPVPQWFGNAKFGIMVHWGVYSVPSYRPFGKEKEGTYAEWYEADVMNKPEQNDSFHIHTYGKNFAYRDFATMFKAELFNPNQWAQLFKDAGAKYVIFTAKHHDGYCMWPTKDIYSKNWNVMDVGPKRDIIDNIAHAVRDKGLRFGIYYSLMEWESTPTPTWGKTGYYIDKSVFYKYAIPTDRYTEHIHSQLRELVNLYQPSIIFADGAWDYDYTYWKSPDFLSWLYSSSPVKDEVVVNDRWGKDCPGKHGGYFSTEYFHGSENTAADHPWEECRGIGYSFGYNRAEASVDYKSSAELIKLLIQIVSKGGNLLLDVGPSADGRIPEIQQERLLDIGNWLKVNGEAIYETQNIRFQESYIPQDPGGERNVYLTTKGDAVYVLITQWPADKTIVITNLKTSEQSAAQLLSFPDKNLTITKKGTGIVIALPSYSPLLNNPGNAWDIKLTDVLLTDK
jgi:alpha-L-fucosidase